MPESAGHWPCGRRSGSNALHRPCGTAQRLGAWLFLAVDGDETVVVTGSSFLFWACRSCTAEWLGRGFGWKGAAPFLKNSFWPGSKAVGWGPSLSHSCEIGTCFRGRLLI